MIKICCKFLILQFKKLENFATEKKTLGVVIKPSSLFLFISIGTKNHVCSVNQALPLYLLKQLSIFFANQGSISSTFYEQLLRVHTPKALKKTAKSSSFFALLGSTSVKAACRTLMKLTPSHLKFPS